MPVTFVVAFSLFMSVFLSAPLALAKDTDDSCQQELLNKALALQIQLPTSPDKPTFLLLPGVNRSMLINDAAIKLLFADGSGVVTMNFKAQPFSIAELPEGQGPAFLKTPVTMASLAEEVSQMREHLEQKYGLKNIIPVSLSFSGAVSPHLKGFPLVVDVVPMTSMAAFNPDLERMRSLWNMNPFFGRGMIDQAYRSTWITQVAAISRDFKLPGARRTEMIEGYMSLSHAAEGASWDGVNIDKKITRIFVLAANENASLFKHQVATILRLVKEGYDVRTIIVQEAGHMLFSEQPQMYAHVLHAIAQAKDIKASPSVLLITPSTGALTPMSGALASEFLSKVSGAN